MIHNKDPGEPQEYAVFIVRFTHHNDAHRSVMVHRQRWGDDRVAFWCFYLGGYMAAVKVDQRLTPSPLSKLILRPSEPLKVFVMKFAETPEYKTLVTAVRRLPGLQ
jgi:hypothetical protein